MKISLIVAMDQNGLIGSNNDLPWRLSSDLKQFKAITMGSPIIMGRKTHESIGRPLPGRTNVIVTRNTQYHADGCEVIHDLSDIESFCKGHHEIFIMGGAELYKQSLHLIDRIYLTEVHAQLDGDTYFPEFDRAHWQEVERQDFTADDKNDYDYSFVVMDRKHYSEVMKPSELIM